MIGIDQCLGVGGNGRERGGEREGGRRVMGGG